MKGLKSVVLFFAAWLALSVLMTGCVCVVHNHAEHPKPVYVKEAPPPPRQEAQPASPGTHYVWVAGAWTWNIALDKWEWAEGAWQQPPDKGSEWVPAKFEERDDSKVFTPGHWSAKGEKDSDHTPSRPNRQVERKDGEAGGSGEVTPVGPSRQDDKKGEKVKEEGGGDVAPVGPTRDSDKKGEKAKDEGKGDVAPIGPTRDGDKKGEKAKDEGKGDVAPVGPSRDSDKKGEKAKDEDKGATRDGDKKGEKAKDEGKGATRDGDKKGEKAKDEGKGATRDGDKKGMKAKDEDKGATRDGDKKGMKAKDEGKVVAGGPDRQDDKKMCSKSRSCNCDGKCDTGELPGCTDCKK
jgi:hypothetical protein